MSAHCLLSLLLAFFASPEPARDYTDTGPLALLVTYRCEPANRPAFRSYLKKDGLARFEQWKRDGVLAEYSLLFNWYVDEGTWDAMAMLRFEEYTDVGRWKVIEETMPGGLSPEALRLATPIETSSADIVWKNHGRDPSKANHRDSVYLVIPYEYLGSVSQYQEYVDGYVIPQLEGWMKEDVLETYEVLLNRFPTGDRWGSLLVLEYRDLEAFGLRKKTKNKVRVGLREIPEWVAWSDIKRTIRQEREPVITERLIRDE